MPDFFWRAAAADGNVVTGRLSAVNEVAAIRQLRSQGLTPLAVQAIGSLSGPVAPWRCAA